jgi:hypothetical protein
VAASISGVVMGRGGKEAEEREREREKGGRKEKRRGGEAEKVVSYS